MIWTTQKQAMCTWRYNGHFNFNALGCEALLTVRPGYVRSSVFLKSLHLAKVYTVPPRENRKSYTLPLVQLQNPCCSLTNQRLGEAGEGYKGTHDDTSCGVRETGSGRTEATSTGPWWRRHGWTERHSRCSWWSDRTCWCDRWPSGTRASLWSCTPPVWL